MCTYVFHFEQLDSSGELYRSGWFPLEEPHYAIEEVLSKNTEGLLLLLSAPPQGQLGGSTALLQLFGALGGSSPLFRQGSEGSPHQNLHLPRFGSLLKGHPFARTGAACLSSGSGRQRRHGVNPVYQRPCSLGLDWSMVLRGGVWSLYTAGKGGKLPLTEGLGLRGVLQWALERLFVKQAHISQRLQAKRSPVFTHQYILPKGTIIIYFVEWWVQPPESLLPGLKLNLGA